MALKYFARYRDIDGDIKEIRFFKDSYDGGSTEWLCFDGAVTFEYAGFDKMFEQPIIPSQARINLHLTEFVDLTEFVYNRKTFFVQVVNTSDGDKIQWSGWVEPWDAQRQHRKPPWQVSLTASCGLAHLSRKKFLNQTNVFKKTGLDIIKECLATAGITRPLRISTHMVETTWGGDDRLGLNSFEMNTSRYYDQNGEAMYCDVIVNDILNHFNAEILQEGNRWVIRGVVDNATGFATSYIDIDDPSAPTDMPFTYEINADEVFDRAGTLNGGTVRILPPKNKYRTEIDFGTQVPFFENGNMVLWGPSGLIGWDFSHMPQSMTSGWEQFVIAGEVSRSVLKINGKSPNPLRKKKKKKFLQVLIPILVGAIGAALKNKYIDVEPKEYIESPGGIISRGDKSVVISFDYETEAFSSDILIAIRVPIENQKTLKIVDFWVDPNSHPALVGADKSTASLTEQFTLIRVPAVDMGALTQKGNIDVSGNPNYPAATYVPGGKDINWTWTVTGVPSGEYRRIGGVNGVLVENGDLVIARVPNNGGSQAEVGGNWEIIGSRNNIKKGTFSLNVSINTTIFVKAGEKWPADKIYVRFYKMADDKGLPGDWYKIYNLNGALEGFVAKEESARYATILQRGDVTDEEAETISLISGDYNPWYAGSWTKPGSKDNTRTWRRRPDLDEAMSIYRAMMLDRLSLTSRPLKVVEGEIRLAPGKPRLSILHTLKMMDMDGIRMRMTRFAYNDYNRTIRFMAIEVKYEEIPRNELKQDSYIPGSRQLNTVPGEGDGIYPSKQDSTSGRLSAEDMPLTDDEVAESLEQGSRLAALFEGIPPLIFIAGEASTASVNLNAYISEVVKYNNQPDPDAEDPEADVFDFDSLRWKVKEKPSWVTKQTVVFLDVSVTGKPVYTGNYSIIFQVGEQTEEESEEAIAEAMAEAEANDEEYLPTQPFYIDVEIPIIVFPKTLYDYKLIDAESGAVIGLLPGVYRVPEKKWDIRVSIKGPHEWWQMSLFGGGAKGKNEPLTTSETVELTNSGLYEMFTESGGILTEAGQYRHFTTTQVSKVTVSRANMVFTLYDDEFLAAGQFFLRKGSVNIGEITLDGASVFENPEGCDVVFVSDGVEHDRVILKLTTKTEQPVHDNKYDLQNPAEQGEYAVYGADTLKEIGIYTISASVYLGDEEIATRFTDFELAKKKPVAAGGGGSLALMQKVPGQARFTFLADLPLSGSEHELPDPAFNVKVTGDSEPFVNESWTYQIIRGGVLTTVDLSKYTGKPQFVNYANPITNSGLLIFGNIGSDQIDSIHEEDTTHRVIVTRRDDDGNAVAILQADFSFGTFEDPDDVPDEDEVDDIVDIRARVGMSEKVIDYIKYLDTRVDNLTLEVRSPNDPLVNYLQVKEKGILFKHLQEIPGKTVIGRTALGVGPASAIKILTLLTEGTDGVTSPGYIDELIEGIINGTANYIPRFAADGHSLVDSAIYQYQGNIGIGITTPIDALHVNGSVVASKSFISQVPTNTPPLIVASSTLVTNLHADLLNKSIFAGTGLTGGGLLNINRTLAVLFGSIAGTVAQGNDPRFTTGIAGNERWIGNPIEFSSIDNINKGGVRTWGSAAGGPTTFGTSLTFVGSSTTGDSAAGSFVHQILAGTDGEWFVRYGAGAGPTWGATYRLWTTKHFSALQVTHWDTAYSWGNHAGLYVPLARQVIAGVGLVGGGPLTSNVTLSVDFGVVAGTAVEGNDPRVNAGNSAETRWIAGANIISDINNITNGGIRSWASSTANKPSNTGTVLTFAGNTATGNAIAGGYMSQLFAGQDENWFVRTGAGSPTSWGSTYQLWTTKQFTAARVATWDLAFSWGDHSIVGYALALNAVANNVNGLNWNTAHVDGRHKLHGSATNSPTGFSHYGMTVTSSDGQTAVSMAFRNGAGFFKTVEGGAVGGWIQFADRDWVNAKQVVAGNGLTGGSNLASNPVITLGTPSTITNATTNSVSATSHTHDIQVANLLPGTNVTLSASGTGVILGPNNITINVTSVPWSTGVSSKPTTLSGFGILDGVTSGTYTAGLATKENTFGKGNITYSGYITVSGDLTNRLVGVGDVNFSITSIPWSAVSGKPTTLAGYGLDDEVYSKSQVDYLDSQRALASHTHTSAVITDFTSAARNSFSGAGGISVNNATGVISYTGGTGVSGSGTVTRVAVWGSGNTLTQSDVMSSSSGQVTINGNLVVQFGDLFIPVFDISHTSTTPNDGAFFVNSAGNRLYVRIGGAWKSAALI